MVVNVHTVGAEEKLGRKELLQWINKFTDIQNQKIEDLSNAVSFCVALSLVFKDCTPVIKVRRDVKFEYEFIQNWKLIQAAFVELKVEKDVPVNRLSRSRFQENLEFLQWFKKFIDANLEESISIIQDENTPIIEQHPLKQVTPTKNSVQKRVTQTAATPTLMQLDVVEQNLVIACRERDCYFQKLQEIEEILKEDCNRESCLGRHLLKVLYSEDRV